MIITVNWQAVSAICAVATLALGLHLFVILALVRAEIRKLNGTYLRTEIAELRFQQMNERIKRIRWMPRGADGPA